MAAKAQVVHQSSKKAEFQVKEQVKTKEAAHLKKEAHEEGNGPDKRQTSKEDKGSQLSKVEPNEGQVEQNLNKQNKANFKVAALITPGVTRPMGDPNANQREGSVMNGAVKHHEKVLVCSHQTKQQSLDVLTSSDRKSKGGPQEPKPAVTTHLSPPVIKLEPLDVTCSGSCDEVQWMDVR